MAYSLDTPEMMILLDKVHDRIKSKLMIANAGDELDIALRELNMEDLIEPLPKKPVADRFSDGIIVIIGGGQVTRNQIDKVAKSLGIKPKRIETCLGYDEAEAYNFNKLKNFKYAAVLLGSMGHSIAGMKNYSSMVSRLMHEQGFPRTIKCEAKLQLKLNQNQIEKGLRQLISEGVIERDFVA